MEDQIINEEELLIDILNKGSGPKPKNGDKVKTYQMLKK